MSKCRYSKQSANDYYDDNVDRYYQERQEAFIENIKEQALKYLENREGKSISMIDFSYGIEEFEFPNEVEWLDAEYEGAIDSCADQAYEEERDRKMGLC